MLHFVLRVPLYIPHNVCALAFQRIDMLICVYLVLVKYSLVSANRHDLSGAASQI